MKFMNPTNEYTEEVHNCFILSLIFGSLYFLNQRVWGVAVLSVICALFTGGLSWIVFPFFAKEIVRKTYLRNGWLEVTE